MRNCQQRSLRNSVSTIVIHVFHCVFNVRIEAQFCATLESLLNMLFLCFLLIC